MNIAITGATSFIGVPMVNSLTKAGHQVYAIVRPSSKNLNRLPADTKGLHIIECNMNQLDTIHQKIDAQCQRFYHFGWEGAGSVNRTNRSVQQKNVEDSLKALEGARLLGCSRFLFSGSQAEYGIHQEAMSENTICKPVSEYGKAKVDFYRQAAETVKKWNKEYNNFEYIHTRIFSIYGKGDHPWSLVESCLRAFLSGSYISLGECTQMWNFLYIDDLIKALMLLMETEIESINNTAVYNVAGTEDETRPLREYVRMIYEECGFHGSYSYGRRPQNAEGPANLIPDTTKLWNTVKWKPEIDFPNGIRRMLTAYQSNQRSY